MKKIISVCLLTLSFCALGYTSEDVSNATYLADQGIVTKQSTASKYRLNDKILRQEVIGMALKVKGVTLPENYTCKKYFADATKNDWVCRAVELAADNGIITRSNKYANPGKSITRAEALAMVMKAQGTDISAGVGSSEGFVYLDKNEKYAEGWQLDIMETARRGGIITPQFVTHRVGTENFLFTEFSYYWRHNDSATRAEVFEFTKKTKISSFDKVYSNDIISFKYPSEYFNMDINKTQTVSLKQVGNEITFGSNDGINDVNISVKYYQNIYSDSEILKSLGYTDNEDCKNPAIQDKKTLSSGVVTFNPVFLERMGLCGINQMWKGLHFPQQGILISIGFGQAGQSQILMNSKTFESNFDSNLLRIEKFLEGFRVVTE